MCVCVCVCVCGVCVCVCVCVCVFLPVPCASGFVRINTVYVNFPRLRHSRRSVTRTLCFLKHTNCLYSNSAAQLINFKLNCALLV